MKTDSSVYDDLSREVARDKTKQCVLVTHTRFHLDEAFSVFLFIMFALRRFRGLSLETVLYWGTGGTRTPDGRHWSAHVADGRILLGCAGGSPFDEHAINGSQADRDDCCSTRVARYLGLLNIEALQGMIRIIQEQDTRGGGGPLDMAVIMKAMHRVRPDEEVMLWSMHGIQSCYDNNVARIQRRQRERRTNFGVVSDKLFELQDLLLGLWVLDVVGVRGLPRPPKGTESFLDLVLRKRRVGPEMIFFLNMIKKKCKAHNQHELQLVTLAEAMIRLGQDESSILRWVFEGLDAAFADSRMFQEAMKSVDRIAVKKTVPFRDKELQVWILECDNYRASAAARSRGADVVIQRDKEGHSFIFFNKVSFGKLITDDEAHEILRVCVGNLRTGEMDKAGVSTHHITMLRSEGSLDGMRVWFYHRALWAMLNGSESSSDVPPSKLSLDEIFDCCSRALKRFGTITVQPASAETNTATAGS